jgi:hypothetical protein
MNHVQYKKYCEKYGKKEVDKYTKDVHIKDVEIDKNDEAQFRAGGHAVSKVPSYAELMKTKEGKAAFPPTSVEQYPSGKVAPKDGCTRLLAEKENFAIGDSDGLAKVSTFVSEFLTKKDPNFTWDNFQAEANNHISPTPNTKDDGEAYVKRVYDNGDLKKSCVADPNKDLSAFVKEAADFLKASGLFSNSGWRITTYRGFVEKAVGNLTSKTFYNYNKQTAIEAFAAHNDLGYDPIDPSKAKAGDIHNGVAPYLMGKTSKMSPVVLGNAAWKLIDNADCKCPVIYWEEKTTVLTPASLKEKRATVLKSYNKIQAKYGIFSGLYFLPQIKGEENRNKLIKAV